jgi:probable HAF family extracellular repeat protein
MIGLGDLPGGNEGSQATAISSDGFVVVGWGWQTLGSGGLQTFRWTEAAGMVALGKLAGDGSSRATATSADGSVIVGQSCADQLPSPSSTDCDAVIWDEVMGMRALAAAIEDELGVGALDSWILTGATDISDDGRMIVGHGINPSGFNEAWLFSVPEPAGTLLFATAIAALAFRQRRVWGSRA